MTAERPGKSPASPGSVRGYFTGKELLVTGATGFVARVLIEKVLRDLPEIGRIHVLIRPGTDRFGKTESADQRLHREVLGSTVFDKLREACGDGFDVMVRAKLVAVEGDLSAKDLGLSPDVLRRLQSTVRVIVNSAGVVSFDASLQTAYQTNTMGPLRVLEFARGCEGAVFAHVSTCYVNGPRQGVVPEEPMDPNSDMTEGRRSLRRRRGGEGDRQADRGGRSRVVQPRASEAVRQGQPPGGRRRPERAHDSREPPAGVGRRAHGSRGDAVG